MGFSDQKNEGFAHLDKSCTKLRHKRKPDSQLQIDRLQWEISSHQTHGAKTTKLPGDALL